jgi:two-component sensor histidine kinase
LEFIFTKKSLLYLRNLISVLLVFLLVACNSASKKNNPQTLKNNTAAVLQLIKKGDSIYAQKADYSSFSKSLELYDTAWQIAVNTNDTNLIAATVFAKGRAYDAINSNPQKTIDYYSQAAMLYTKVPDNEIKGLYIKHLVAHSYDKIKDSINCIKTLHELYAQILPMPDSLKKKMLFIAEMALISTEVKNYVLADSILQHLTKREWIKNDPTEYDYLNHFYLTKARICVNQKQHSATAYLDSVEKVLSTCRNLSDSMYYSSQLWDLYKTLKNSNKTSYYLQLNNVAFNKFNSPEKVSEAQAKLSKMEVATIEMQRKMELEKNRIRNRYFYVLIGLLGIISLLALFLVKRSKEIKRKNSEVLVANAELHQKNIQNEILNKEIHHRVKNNLEMIASLVYMQERNTDTEEVKENMQNISLRIESIANLHHQLMEQSDSVDIKIYIQQLVANVSQLLGDNKKVLTHLEIQPIVTPQKISFPLGLIINEWITNSVKYAVPATAPLTIFIEIHNGDNEIKVNYRDNGKPQTVKPNKKSLGLDIVNLLTAQLRATIKTDAENIFTYHLTIPIDNGE